MLPTKCPARDQFVPPELSRLPCAGEPLEPDDWLRLVSNTKWYTDRILNCFLGRFRTDEVGFLSNISTYGYDRLLARVEDEAKKGQSTRSAQLLEKFLSRASELKHKPLTLAPLNVARESENTNHWVLMVVISAKQELQLWDSMRSETTYVQALEFARLVGAVLGLPKPPEPRAVHVPQQGNLSDCGPFTCAFGSFVFARRDELTSADYDYVSEPRFLTELTRFVSDGLVLRRRVRNLLDLCCRVLGPSEAKESKAEKQETKAETRVVPKPAVTAVIPSTAAKPALTKPGPKPGPKPAAKPGAKPTSKAKAAEFVPRTRAELVRWGMVGEEGEEDELPEVDCGRLASLRLGVNPCYFDTALVALFFRPIDFLTQNVLWRKGPDKLASDVADFLRRLVEHLRGGKVQENCPRIRQLFEDFRLRRQAQAKEELRLRHEAEEAKAARLADENKVPAKRRRDEAKKRQQQRAEAEAKHEEQAKRESFLRLQLSPAHMIDTLMDIFQLDLTHAPPLLWRKQTVLFDELEPPAGAAKDAVYVKKPLRTRSGVSVVLQLSDLEGAMTLEQLLSIDSSVTHARGLRLAPDELAEAPSAAEQALWRAKPERRFRSAEVTRQLLRAPLLHIHLARGTQEWAEQKGSAPEMLGEGRSRAVVPPAATLQPLEGRTLRLLAIIKHVGSVQGGHYTCYLNCGRENGWYLFDDLRKPMAQHVGAFERVATDAVLSLATDYIYAPVPLRLVRERALRDVGCEELQPDDWQALEDPTHAFSERLVSCFLRRFRSTDVGVLLRRADTEEDRKQTRLELQGKRLALVVLKNTWNLAVVVPARKSLQLWYANSKHLSPQLARDVMHWVKGALAPEDETGFEPRQVDFTWGLDTAAEHELGPLCCAMAAFAHLRRDALEANPDVATSADFARQLALFVESGGAARFRVRELLEACCREEE